MACDLKPTCDFIFGFLLCTLPMVTIDIELTVRTIQGIHMYRKDQISKQVTCSPSNRLMKPFLSLQKKIEAYEEEKKDKNSPFHPNPIQFTKTNLSAKRSRERSNGRRKQRKLDMGCSTPPKAKRPANMWALLPATKSATATTTTTTMATNPKMAAASPPLTSSCKMCKRWGPPHHFCA